MLLLNGQRISGFRELRDIPTEAIQRVEILPEEVALKYGYRADQKVVNIVLRQRFRSTAAQVGANDGDRRRLCRRPRRPHPADDPAQRPHHRQPPRRRQRHADRERARHLARSQSPAADHRRRARRAVADRRASARCAARATLNRTILGDVSATFNGELEHDEGRALDRPWRDICSNRSAATPQPIARMPASRSTATRSEWRWTLTGNADLDRDVTRTDRDDARFPRDRARETPDFRRCHRDRQRHLFKLPAGDASATLTVGGKHRPPRQQRAAPGDRQPNLAGAHDGQGGGQPRPAGLAPQPRVQRTRQSDAQRQCGGRPTVGLRHADDARRRRQLVAGRPAQFPHQLDPRGRGRRPFSSSAIRFSKRPARGSSTSRPAQTVLVNAITGGNPTFRPTAATS